MACMYRLPCFALLVLLMATTKIHYGEQVLVAELVPGTKHSSQAGELLLK